ncbi:Gtpase activating protein [Dimargaris verticillata]|uniref:Gtpase activating protein n=1 Tax=Dimargaris verticillata TaxID=2761393 RepID=A0A9W8B5C7_9FUNG|nr:Gtpase activating protein [Dimargaris verticillata]
MASMTSKDKKRMQEKHEKILVALTKEPANSVCADCNQPGPRWASWNLGVFLCIRCSGFHRKMGTHISRVKSISLDVWTPEQIESIQAKGNAVSNARYNPHADLHPPPSGDREMEQYIRNKYERKLFMNQSALESDATASRNHRAPPTPARPSGTSRTVPSETGMARLRSMGFNDEVKNATALRRAHGNLEQAIDFLVADSPGLDGSTTASTPKPSAAPTPKPDPMMDLLGLDDGFTSSSAAPGTSGQPQASGSMASLQSALACTTLSSQPSPAPLGLFPRPPGMNQPFLAQPVTKSPESTDANDFGQFTDASFFSQPAAPPAATPTAVSNASALSALSPGTAKFDKNSILSLYSTNKPAQPVAASNPMVMGLNVQASNANVWQTASPAQQPLTTQAPMPNLVSTPRGATTNLTAAPPAASSSLLDFGSFASPAPAKPADASFKSNSNPKSNKDLFGEFSDLLH